jgi:hypothetical protein
VATLAPAANLRNRRLLVRSFFTRYPRASDTISRITAALQIQAAALTFEDIRNIKGGKEDDRPAI